jgi:hypothetical protein
MNDIILPIVIVGQPVKVGVLVSSPGEFHPQALSEPDLRLSPHPAPIIQPLEALF